METNRSITPILWLRKSTDTVGQVKIRITENRKSTYVSLGFKIPAKLWNDNANEVRTTKDVHRVGVPSWYVFSAFPFSIAYFPKPSLSSIIKTVTFNY